MFMDYIMMIILYHLVRLVSEVILNYYDNLRITFNVVKCFPLWP